MNHKVPYVAVNNTEIFAEDLAGLPIDTKVALLESMFGEEMHDGTLKGKLNFACSLLGIGTENDNQGQIVLYTGMQFTEDGKNVVPFLGNAHESVSVSELEEEEEIEPIDESLPDTLRDPSLANMSREQILQAAKEGAEMTTSAPLLDEYCETNISED